MNLISRISISFGVSLVFASLIFSSNAGATDPNWPQWRGPSGQGTSLEKNLPAEWTANKNVKWKTTIPGRGHSSPIVWGNRIFLTTAIEQDLVPGAKAVTHMDGDKVFAPDSVGADHKHLFEVICLNAKTGKILWEQTTFEVRHMTIAIASSYAASTPATDGTYVYAFFGTEAFTRTTWRAS